MKNALKRQEGQSIVIIAFALVALVALLALVVDAGNAYVQRRQIQNAMDSGAQAGALSLAQGKSSGQINDAITKFVSANGVTDLTRIHSYYVGQNASLDNVVIRDNTISSYGYGFYPTVINGMTVVGVQVEGDKTFPTFFAGIVGVKQMPVSGGSAAFSAKGACYGSGLFPIAVSSGNFPVDSVSGQMTVHYEDTEPTYSYRIWQKVDDLPVSSSSGNFGWLYWHGQTASTSTLATDMDQAENGISGGWSVGESIGGSTLLSASSGVQTELSQRVSGTQPSAVVVPVYDQFSGSGNSGLFHIAGFARFHITGYSFAGTDKYIEGKFQKWVDPSAEGGCSNFGVATVKVRPPIDTERAVAGTIKIQKLTLTQGTPTYTHVPVDVVNILDISGSMSDNFGSKTKLRAAKDALKAFNSNMQPTLGDQVALATFPNITSGSSYHYTCAQSGNTSSYYWGEVRSTLSTNITSTNTIIEGLSANGGTPIGDGLKKGLATVLGTGHNSSRIAVIILATDGNTNIRLNGVWTGYSGNGTAPSCNQYAEQDLLDQANLAKGDTNPHDYKPDTILFTIAVGDDFNPSLLQAVATTDTDASKPHYFHVTDANSMASIYQQISTRVQQIGSEYCQIIPTEDFARGALVTIRFPNGTTKTVTATSNGEFVLTGTDVVDGTYTIVSASVTVNGITYSTFTDGLGGAALTSSPTVVAGTATGTYRTDLFLKTATALSCGN